MAINLISKIKPKNDGAFPVYEDVDVEGGYQVRTDLTDRDSIPALNRKEGMLVYVQEEEIYYTLTGGITNDDWVEAQMGGGGFTPGGDVFGNSTDQIVVGLNDVPIPEEYPENSDMIIFDSSTQEYQFVKKNSCKNVINYSDHPLEEQVNSTDEIILSNSYSTNYILPENPANGERHTFIYSEGESSVTILYSQHYDSWYVIGSSMFTDTGILRIVT